MIMGYRILDPQQFCVSNGGSFEVIEPACNIETKSNYSITDAFIGHHVQFPNIGIGYVENVQVWNDNYGVFKDNTYLLDTPAIVAGEPFFQIGRPHGITYADDRHMAIPNEITSSTPTKMAGEYILLGTNLANHSHMLDMLSKCLLAKDYIEWKKHKFIIDADCEKYI